MVQPNRMTDDLEWLAVPWVRFFSYQNYRDLLEVIDKLTIKQLEHLSSLSSLGRGHNSCSDYTIIGKPINVTKGRTQ